MEQHQVQLAFSEYHSIGKEQFVGKFAQIIELYDQLESKVKQRKSYCYRGVASFQLPDNNPKEE